MKLDKSDKNFLGNILFPLPITILIAVLCPIPFLGLVVHMLILLFTPNITFFK